MTTPGQTFVVHSDLGLLACDDILIPTDANYLVTEAWKRLGEPPRSASNWGDQGARVTPAVPGDDPGRTPRKRWVNTGSTPAFADVSWLCEGIRQAFEAVAQDQTSTTHLHGRQRRLVGLPTFGTGQGGFDKVRGEALDGLLEECEQAAQRYDFDVVLTCYHRSDYAAVQARRVHRASSNHGLSPELIAAADALGKRAANGGLALFIGAGVSKPAGLPTWPELIRRLADRSTAYQGRHDELAQIPAPDAAYLLKSDSPEMFDDTLKGLLGAPCFAIGHALLASLRVQESITTNFDTLYEAACAVPMERKLVTLPWHRAVPGRPWLLKMHGDVDSKDIVLSRKEFLGYDTLWRPLASVLQSAMMTKHVLFVGYSLMDENFIRLGRDVSYMFQRVNIDRLVGTVLTLRPEAVMSELWQNDLASLAMSDGHDTDSSGAARNLEVFLDRVAMSAAGHEHSYLLDPRYLSIIPEADRPLAESLRDIGEKLKKADPTTWGTLVETLKTYGLR